MSILSSLSNRKSKTSKRSTDRKRKRIRDAKRSLAIECLENRMLLSTFTVNTTADTVDANPGDGMAQDAIGNTSLRAAVMESNALAGDDCIKFNVTGTINLTGALPDLDSNLQIDGPGAANLTVRRDTGGDYRIFTIASGSTVVINGLTISDGLVDPNGVEIGGAIANLGGSLTVSGSTFSKNDGGGIFNTGTLTVSGSTFGSSTETANKGHWFGGLGTNETPFNVRVGSGIYNDNGGEATVSGSTFSDNTGSGIFNHGESTITTLTVSDSTFSRNQAGAGAGIFNYGLKAVTEVNNSTFFRNAAFGGEFAAGGGINSFPNIEINGDTTNSDSSLTVSNSTFSENQAGYNVAGEYVGGGGYGGGLGVGHGSTAEINNSTFSGNRAFTVGGGVLLIQSTLTIGNTIIAGNTTDDGKSDDGPDIFGVFGPVTSNGYNLIGNTSTSSGWVGSDQTGTHALPLNPLLAPRGNYGGPTQTMALLPGSTAIDRGSNALVDAGVIADQRGLPYTRINGASVDIGAFESPGLNVGGTAGDDSITIAPGTQVGTLKTSRQDALFHSPQSLQCSQQ